MESMISGLTRASVGASAPMKTMLMSVTSELRKLNAAKAGILARAGVDQTEEEVSVQGFIKEINVLAEFAQEPLQSWLEEIGKALSLLDDAMAMPPPPPNKRRKLQHIAESVEIAASDVVTSVEVAGGEVSPRFGRPSKWLTHLGEAPQSPLVSGNNSRLPDLAQTLLPLEIAEAVPGHVVVRLSPFRDNDGYEEPMETADEFRIGFPPLPQGEEQLTSFEESPESTRTVLPVHVGFEYSGPIMVRLPARPIHGSREAPIPISDSPLIKCEPAEDNNTLSTLEDGDLHETAQTIQAHRSPRELDMQPPAFRNVPMGPKAFKASNGHGQSKSDLQKYAENQREGPKRFICKKCNVELPSRKKLTKHMGRQHADGRYPLRQLPLRSHSAEGIGPSFSFGQVPQSNDAKGQLSVLEDGELHETMKITEGFDMQPSAFPSVPTGPKAFKAQQQNGLPWQHGQTGEGKASKCLRCNAEFPKRRQLKRHMEKAHLDFDENDPLYRQRLNQAYASWQAVNGQQSAAGDGEETPSCR